MKQSIAFAFIVVLLVLGGPVVAQDGGQTVTFQMEGFDYELDDYDELAAGFFPNVAVDPDLWVTYEMSIVVPESWVVPVEENPDWEELAAELDASVPLTQPEPDPDAFEPVEPVTWSSEVGINPARAYPFESPASRVDIIIMETDVDRLLAGGYPAAISFSAVYQVGRLGYNSMACADVTEFVADTQLETELLMDAMPEQFEGVELAYDVIDTGDELCGILLTTTLDTTQLMVEGEEAGVEPFFADVPLPDSFTFIQIQKPISADAYAEWLLVVPTAQLDGYASAIDTLIATASVVKQ
ncbi:MAG: hypothetical protein GYB65_00150 [Chloroflexi bacterium]|nr:hypothetical protein [Chloroflexota bacterium]